MLLSQEWEELVFLCFLSHVFVGVLLQYKFKQVRQRRCKVILWRVGITVLLFVAI